MERLWQVKYGEIPAGFVINCLADTLDRPKPNVTPISQFMTALKSHVVDKKSSTRPSNPWDIAEGP